MTNEDLFNRHKTRLADIAHHAVKRAHPNSFILLLLLVDDPQWTAVANALFPDHDWQQVRDRGEQPIVHGIIPNSLAEYLVARGSKAPATLFGPPPAGMVRALVCGHGCGIYAVIPHALVQNT